MSGMMPEGPSAVDAGVAGVITRLRSRAPLPLLFPARPWAAWDAGMHRRLTSGDLTAAPAKVRAGLLLWNDALEDSHAVAQGIEDADGAYWHGIMHRREGDLDNAGYWFRRVGSHPAFPAVQAQAVEIARAAGLGGNAWAAELARSLEPGPWDPHRFIALCGGTRNSAGPHPVLERIQVAEFECLLQHCRGLRGGYKSPLL